MKLIRILPINVNYRTWTEEDVYNYWPVDREKYRIVIEQDNPEYLMVSISHLVYSREVFDLFKRLYSRDRIVIFDGDEAISPDLNLFDYAVTYDDALFDEDRVCHRPFDSYQYDWVKDRLHVGNRLSPTDAAEEYEKRRFCNFLYSNSKAYTVRDELFYEVSKYKFVDSLGKHLNNVRNDPDRDNESWFGSSVDIKKSYRFSIAAENGSMRGYTSEKIVSSLLANSIPIYWGNKSIENEFNPKAFINCHKYKSIQDVVNAVSEIEDNIDKWIEMVTAPWQTERQIENMRQQNIAFKAFINHIFEKDIIDAKRCQQTTATWNYVDFWLRK